MKVLLLASSFPPAVGGVERHLESTIPLLQQQGHQFVVMAPGRGPDPYLGCKVYRLDDRSMLGRWREMLSFRGEEIDLVHVHDWHAALWSLPMLTRMGKPLVVTFHGYDTEAQQTHPARKVVDARARRTLIVGSYLQQLYGHEPDACIVGGVTVPNEIAPWDDRAGVIYLGRLEADTGFSTYLELFEDLHQSGYPGPLTVVGGGSLVDQIPQYVSHRGVLRDPGPVLETHRFLIASGFLSILEGYAHGMVVMATAVNDLRRSYLESMPGPLVLGPTTYLRDRIMENDHDDQIAQGRKTARDHPWERVADLYHQWYEEVGA